MFVCYAVLYVICGLDSHAGGGGEGDLFVLFYVMFFCDFVALLYGVLVQV